MTTLSSKISFGDFSRHLEKISTIPRDKKSDYLTKYIAWFMEFTKKVKESESAIVDDGFYPILRLLLPQLDRERSAYGIKEHTLAKVYIRILCLPKEGQDAAKLLNYRAPRTAGKQAGDFSDVAYWVLKSRCPQGATLSIYDINMHLDNIAFKHAAHDPRGVDGELMIMLRSMSAEEQKWLIRVLLKDMKLGLGQSKIFNAFHPDARELYDVSNNLSKVCEQLRDPLLRLHEIEVSVFSPFRAMLAERKDVQVLTALMRSRSFFYMETKFDGERFQLHMSEGNFRYFSKNAFDFTDTYGSSVHSGLLTPHIAKLMRHDVQSCIIDGEMMAWNTKLKCFRAKGLGFDVKSLKVGDLYRPCFCVFDILLLNGEILSNKPLEERCSILDGLFTPAEGILLVTSRRKVTEQKEVIEELNTAIDNQLEGVMLKDPASIYKPNARKGGWFKIKPEYTDGLMDHLDLLIIGGYYGKRNGIISHFLVAAGVPSPTDSTGELGTPSVFHSVGRVGSGYTILELAELLDKLTPHWQRVRPGFCPTAKGIEWTEEKPDVWIPPEKSYILEIKASEVYVSNKFRTGCTMRFPRVEKIRYDKKWFECTTTLQLEEMRLVANGKLYSRHVASDASLASPPKKARRVTSAPVTLGDQFRSADLSGVVQTSTLLAGREFCVLTGWENLSKQDIETKIVESGGTVVQNLRPTTFCAVAADETRLRVRNAVKCGLYDIAYVEWLLHSLPPNECKNLPRWRPSDLIARSPRTAECLAEDYDLFGDSFTTPATVETLSYSLSQAKKIGIEHFDQKEIADFDIELFSGPSPYGIFRLCNAYIDNTVENLLDITATDFGFYGGKVTEQITEETTHVILHSESLSRDKLTAFKELNHSRRCTYHIVTELWIQSSIQNKMRLPETMMM